MQRGARNVLDALHQVHQHVLASGRARSETNATVTHNQGRHAITERRVEFVVPRRLSVEMRVHVYPTRSDDGARSIEFALACKVGSNGGDHAVVDSQVADKRRGASSVHDRS